VLKCILQRYAFDFHQVHLLINTAYYFFILLGIFTAVFFFYRRMLQAGYPKRKVELFIFLMAVFSFPLGYISSRAGGILHYPLKDWSLELLYNQATSGMLHTFHASLIVPVAFFFLLTVIFRFAEMRVVDAAFLHVPLAHAIGRLGCLSAGCCWGKPVDITLFGNHLSFTHPTPLYAVLANLAIFFVLNRIYNRIYIDTTLRNKKAGTFPGRRMTGIRFRERFGHPLDYVRNKGGIVGGYFLLYGTARFLMEFIRTNKIEEWGLTQPQLVMILFILTGAFILFLTQKNPRYSVSSPDLGTEQSSEEETGYETGKPLRESPLNRFLPLASYLVFLFVTMGAVFYLVGHGYIRWPFTGSARLATLYAGIARYLPMFFLACLSLLWLKWAKIPLLKQFAWRRFSNIFFVGFIISAWYSMYLLIRNPVDMSRIFFWIPVIMLSLLNAFSEEVFYRLVLFELLRKLIRPVLLANILQSAVYALPHYFIGGMRFALFAFLYGILLGLIKEKNESILPSMICHFVIDLGNIGTPLLLTPAIFS